MKEFNVIDKLMERSGFSFAYPKNLDDKCFQYTFAFTQCHGEIKNCPEKISNIKSLLNIYDWTVIEYPQQS